MTPLHLVEEGQEVKIVKIDAGYGLSRQLRNMGLLHGETIRVVHNSRGPLIIAKGHLRFALGRGMSFKIFVEEVQDKKA